jgi:hypothetical protein
MSPKNPGNGGQQPHGGEQATAEPNRAATVARLAYDKWQARGCPEGDDLRDWLEAETELRAAGPQPTATAAAPSRNRA